MTQHPQDFRMFVSLIYDDIIQLAEKQHSLGAYTSLSMVLAKCYQIAEHRDPLLPENKISTMDLMTWGRLAKDSVNIKTWTPYEKISDKLGKVIFLTAVGVEKGVEKGASFPFIIGLVQALARGFYLHTGEVLAPAFNVDAPPTDLKKLLNWAFEFRHTMVDPLKAITVGNIYKDLRRGK